MPSDVWVPARGRRLAVALGRRIAVAHAHMCCRYTRRPCAALRRPRWPGHRISLTRVRVGFRNRGATGCRVKRRGDGRFRRLLPLGVAADDGFERPARRMSFRCPPAAPAGTRGRPAPDLPFARTRRCHGVAPLLLVGAMCYLEAHGRQHGAFQLDARDAAHAFADARAGEATSATPVRIHEVRVAVRSLGQDQDQSPGDGQPVEQASSGRSPRLAPLIQGRRQIQVDGQHLAAARGGAGDQLLQARTLELSPSQSCRTQPPVSMMPGRRRGACHVVPAPRRPAAWPHRSSEHAKTFQRRDQRGDQAGADHMVRADACPSA